MAIFWRKKTAKNEDLYIRVLEYGKENIGNPIKYAQIKQQLDDEGYEYDEFALKQFFCEVFVDGDFPSGNEPGRINETGEYYLEAKGYFNLLEYIELKEARASSKIATYFAAAALTISALSFLASIFFTLKNIGS